MELQKNHRFDPIFEVKNWQNFKFTISLHEQLQLLVVSCCNKTKKLLAVLLSLRLSERPEVDFKHCINLLKLQVHGKFQEILSQY